MRTRSSSFALRRVAVLAGVAAAACTGCGGGRLPPPRILESGCHVWYEHGYVRQGYYAEMTGDGTARIEGSSATRARRKSAREIEWEGKIVGRVEGSRLRVGWGTPRSPVFVVDLLPYHQQLSVRTLAGEEWTRLRVSPSCTAEDVALGAAPLTLVIANGGQRRPVAP